jgi:glycogen synthase
LLAERRIGLSIAGDARDPSAYSGAPASLLAALENLGVEVEPVSADLGARSQRLLTNVLTLGFMGSGTVTALLSGENPRLAFRANKPKLLPSREMTAIRSAVVARRLHAIQPVARVIQFGSEYRLPRDTDYVTLDDATIVQLQRSYPYHWMQVVSPQALRRMIARQRQIFRGARACCVLNAWAARSAIEDYGVPAERVHVVGTGPNRQLSSVPRSWDVPRFLFVGKDFKRKNGQLVVEAFSTVRARHADAELHVVGEHPSLDAAGIVGHGPLRLDDENESAKLNELFGHATCLVMPSLLEPTGNVHAEALAAGIGSIGTTRGGVATVIGDSGILVDPDDRDGLARAMLRFCDPDAMADFGRRAERRAPLFTWRAVAERVIRALALPGIQADGLAAFL